MKKRGLSGPSFVKWAGGKRQLLEQFKPYFPNKIERYFEPFVGGGAVAFHILRNQNPKEVCIFDVNEELINCYNIIKYDVEKLIKALKGFRKNHSEKTYYWIRATDTESLSRVARAARFIYLNKTCFNGLYRVNSKGEFNVPIGSYKNPEIFSEDELRYISGLLKRVKIKKSSFEGILDYAKKGDFIYFDPPYYPVKKDSFTSYTKNNFLENEQKKLSEVFRELDKRGCFVMLSNSDTKLIKDLYKNYEISFVRARRMINADASKRGKVNEVVVTNYPVAS